MDRTQRDHYRPLDENEEEFHIKRAIQESLKEQNSKEKSEIEDDVKEKVSKQKHDQ
jgi:hypothetical protein